MIFWLAVSIVREGLADLFFLSSASNHKTVMLTMMTKLSDYEITIFEFLYKNTVIRS